MNEKLMDLTEKLVQKPLTLTRKAMELTDKATDPSSKLWKTGTRIGISVGGGLIAAGSVCTLAIGGLWPWGLIAGGSCTLVSNLIASQLK